MICCIAGGVGAARFLEGLVCIAPARNLSVIVNTGDDMELYDLHISPDLDIVIYTLAGIVDDLKGWGIRGDTFHSLDMLGRYGGETWFKIGDKDLATHIYRSYILRQGFTLSEATARICRSLGVEVNVMPMSDDRVETMVNTEVGQLGFQDYLVKRGAGDKVTGVTFRGSEYAHPALGVVESLCNSDRVIVCPSNPILSIGPILAVPRVRMALRETDARILAISPIVGGAPVKGPTDKIMRGLGLEVSALAVAELYKDFLDVFIIDQIDRELRDRIEALGIEVIVTNTLMKSLRDKVQLARTALEAAQEENG